MRPFSSQSSFRRCALAVCLAGWLAATGGFAAIAPVTFDPASGVVRGASLVVPLGDGKVLAVSEPGTDGEGVTLVRFGADGAVDSTFAPGDLGLAYAAAVTPLADGRVLIAGDFLSPDGTETVSRLVELTADGTPDARFAPNSDYSANPIVLPDGKLLLLEENDDANGQVLTSLVRLNADGSVDRQFDASSAFAPDRDYAIQADADGGLLLSSLGDETAEPTLVRLDANGSIAAFFALPALPGGSVTSILPSADAKVVVAVSNSDGDRNAVLRFNADGSVDGSFRSLGDFDDEIDTLAALPDGGLLVAGAFETVGSTARNALARLGVDGTLDAGYNPLASAAVEISNVITTAQEDVFVALAAGNGAVIDHFTPDGTLAGSLPIADAVYCSLVARPDGSGVYAVVSSPVDDTAGDVAGGVLTATADGGFFPPPPPPGGPIIKGRPIVTIAAVKDKVYSGSSSPGKFVLKRTGHDYSKPLRVVYRINGSAVAGRDYRSVTRVRIIPAGQQTARIAIRPVGARFASVDRGRAKVTVTLSHRPHYRTGTGRSARVKIIDPAIIAQVHG